MDTDEMSFGEKVVLEVVTRETEALGQCSYKGIAKRLFGGLPEAQLDEFLKDAFIMLTGDSDIYIGRTGLTLGAPKVEEKAA